MKTKTGMVLAALVLSALAVVGGCQSDALKDGYQFGDGTKTLIEGAVTVAELRDRYCNGGDQAARMLLLAAVRSVRPDYPEDGLCTGLPELLQMVTDEQGQNVLGPPPES